jgi:hypothetical protein
MSIPSEIELEKTSCCIIALYLILALIFFFYIPDIPSDPETARYFLSTIIQSEAAVIAVAISLSLVMVQIASTAYSIRLLDILKKSYHVWTLLIIYLSLMIYGSWVLMLFGTIDFQESYRDIVIIFRLSIIAFSSLILYFWKIFDLLNPSYLIDKLAEDIEIDKILKIREIGGKNDPIRSVSDIIIGSIYKYDGVTIEYGIKILNKKITELLNVNFLCNDQQKKIGEAIFGSLSSLAKLLILNFHQNSCLHIIETIGSVGISSAGKKFEHISLMASKCLVAIAELSVDRYSKYYLLCVIDNIRAIGASSIEKGLDKSSEESIDSLLKLSGFISMSESSHEISKIIQSLDTLSFMLIPEKFNILRIAIMSLKIMGLNLVNNRLDTHSSCVVASLENIMKLCIENDMTDKILEPIIAVRDLCVAAIKFNLCDTGIVAIRTLGFMLQNPKISSSIKLKILTYLKDIHEESRLQDHQKFVIEVEKYHN